MLGELADGRALGGIDLDSCLDIETRRFSREAREIVARFDTYSEVSPSRRGVKLFFFYNPADLAPLRKLTKTDWSKSFSRGSHDEIALHLGGRYFAVTGRQMDQPFPVELRTVPLEDLRWLIEEAGPAFLGRKASKSRDESRSGRAFRLAIRVRAEGGAFRDFEKELGRNSDLAEWAQESGERGVGRAWERAPKLDDLSESSVAQTFAECFADELRFDHDAKSWFVWNGARWRRDKTRCAFHYAASLAAELAKGNPKAKALLRKTAASGVEALAQANPALAITSDEWDRDPYLFGTPGGVVELRTGLLRPARREDMISKCSVVAPVPLERFDPATDCPQWIRFIREATNSDPEVITYLQKVAGYCLTGDTKEHALFFLYGDGGRGKGTFLNTLQAVLGDYATTAPVSTFERRAFTEHPTELARLVGARLVVTSETTEGSTWNSQRITQITGGDVVAARFLHKDFFEYTPQFKLTVMGNHRPALSSVNDAIRRRFNIIEFNVKPARPDPDLTTKLKRERAGILSWALQGCLVWQREGLAKPKAVQAATNDYFEAENDIGRWLAERCDLDAENVETSQRLWESWNDWCAENGVKERYSRTRTFPIKLKEAGFSKAELLGRNRGAGWRGVRARDGFDD
ncbi:phage/plasmid primase, P4 family [Hansschlegelia zhihuaiae]|uniref:phage/plasmid primase, P4 family n=1 Tax=Hansschlegelia zhihuaiae TaxID=405005 RepID=UPI001FE1C86A|nr:phage/plasmid primase, P4 family [Hansschlegelia zhihuaiae]